LITRLAGGAALQLFCEDREPHLISHWRKPAAGCRGFLAKSKQQLNNSWALLKIAL